jgi:hypothetical protein
VSPANQPVDDRGVTADYAQPAVMARAVLAERRGQPERAPSEFAGMLDSADPGQLIDRRLWLPDLVRLAMGCGAADAAATLTPSCAAAADHCRGLGGVRGFAMVVWCEPVGSRLMNRSHKGLILLS